MAGGVIFGNKRLIGDLSSRRWRMRSDGRWELEPKAEILKRGGRSPDWGDAAAMCYAPRPKNGPEALIRAGLFGPPNGNQELATSMKYVLNPQSRQVELVPNVGSRLVTPFGNSSGKRLCQIYESSKKKYEAISRRSFSEYCEECGEVIDEADHRYTSGAYSWHLRCARKCFGPGL
jgi:hypothetical protein